MNSSIRLLAVAVAVLGLAACTPKVKPPMTNAADTGNGGGEKVEPQSGAMGEDALWAGTDGQAALDGIGCLKTRVVTFDLDRTEIGGDFEAMMACHARFLKTFTSFKLTLGGHADERGTREYNLGLGERRNNAVSDSLKAQGASGSQIEGVSYGEEQPTCSESSDSCWANNRRVEFSYSK
jgi:peptidoglycan-associated lipoprotein